MAKQTVTTTKKITAYIAKDKKTGQTRCAACGRFLSKSKK